MGGILKLRAPRVPVSDASIEKEMFVLHIIISILCLGEGPTSSKHDGLFSDDRVTMNAE